MILLPHYMWAENNKARKVGDQKIRTWNDTNNVSRSELDI